MIVGKLTAVGKNRPPCTHKVHVGPVDTWARRYRVSTAAKAGNPPEVCSARAAYVIDGEPRCANHAGQDALAFLQRKTPDREAGG